MANNSIFRSIMGPNDTILQAAVSAKSLQDIVNRTEPLLQASIVIADALHYILVLSSDLQKRFPDEPDWATLVDCGIVPPVVKIDPQETPPPTFPLLYTDSINADLLVHHSLKTVTGRFCTMCDVLEGSNHVLKIAVTTPAPLTEEQRRLFLTFIQVVQMSFPRFRTAATANRHGRLLKQLINGVPINPVVTGSSVFDQDGKFCMACFNTEHLGVYTLSFSSIFSNAAQKSRYISALIGSQFVILMNTKYDCETPFEFLGAFSTDHRFPILRSETFSDLADVQSQYRELSKCTELATHFSGCVGLHSTSDFAVFRMFLKVNAVDPSNRFLHPDAKILLNHDARSKTQYAQTAFRYLSTDCDAPATAEALFIHRNTLDNRLRKMNEIISADWHNANYKFRMMYSLFILLYRDNLLSW